MTLQTSGQISINDVAGEYDVTGNNRSLTSLSTGAGLTAPHGLKEFYGLSDTIPVTGVSLTVGSFSSSHVFSSLSGFRTSFALSCRLPTRSLFGSSSLCRSARIQDNNFLQRHSTQPIRMTTNI